VRIVIYCIVKVYLILCIGVGVANAEDSGEPQPKHTTNSILNANLVDLKLLSKIGATLFVNSVELPKEIDTVSLYPRIKESVYQVFLVKKNEGQLRLGTRSTFGSGSAVALAVDRLITNCHVVSNPNAEIMIKLDNGRLIPAVLEAEDIPSDRCVLLVKDAKLTPVRGIRTTVSVLPGERVYSIGYPKGFSGVMGEGLISTIRQRGARKIFLTSAAIAKGSSGGGLFDRYGNLVAITTAVIDDAPHLGIAIPAQDFFYEIP
jgi:S1-C subfamily serine protease